jgi:hypothetical protein
MPGAQLLLLDVARTPTEIRIPSAKLPGFDQAAVLRYAWLQLPPSVKSRLLAAIDSPDSDALSLGELRDRIRLRAAQIQGSGLSFEDHVPQSLQNLSLVQ